VTTSAIATYSAVARVAWLDPRFAVFVAVGCAFALLAIEAAAYRFAIRR